MASQNFVTRPGSQFLQSGTGAVTRTVEDKLTESTYVSPLDFGAVGDGVTDDTAALYAAFATGKPVDGLNKTYKVTPDTIIDPYATAGVGYGENKQWFIAGNCRNINYIGAVSFGRSAFFLGKHNFINDVVVTGDARFSAWYTTFQGIIVSGTTYINGDYPPATNWVGCYYNTFQNCDFNAVVIDQRYGPFNDNSFINCQIETFLVKDSGNAGYNPGNLPYKDFHLNCFYGCEFGLGSSLPAPDGSNYPFVIDDSANVGGINRFIGCYMEGSARGFYGEGLEVDNLHLSGNSCTIGAGGLGYNSPLSGEGGYVQRDVPNIYPAGDNIIGGDWSVLNSAGRPDCLTFGNCTVTVVSDSTEPTGLGKCVDISANLQFASADIKFSSTTGHKTLRSFAAIVKTVSGSWSVETKDSAGGTVYGATSVIKLNDGWQMYVGHTYDFVRFVANSAGSVIRISGISGARGAGILGPVTKTKPLIDLSGGSSFVKDYLASQKLTTYSGTQTVDANTAVDLLTVAGYSTATSFKITVNFAKPGYPQYSATCTYIVSIVQTTSRPVEVAVTQLHQDTTSLDISPVPVVTAAESSGVVTVTASTGQYISTVVFTAGDIVSAGTPTFTVL